MENSSPSEKKDKEPTFLYSALDNYGGYPFADLFDFVLAVYKPEDIVSSKGALVLWGGQDISPSIYGQKPGSATWASEIIGSRDQLELNLAGQAIKLGIPIIGICRGAQMMCALAGGVLIQDVSGHQRDHYIKTIEGDTLKTTSVHHQMMYPWNVPDFKLIAWSSPPVSGYYKGGRNEDTEKDNPVTFPENITDTREPEVVYFPEQKAICIQGHPEFIHNEKHEFVQYSRKLVKQYVLSKLQ